MRLHAARQPDGARTAEQGACSLRSLPHTRMHECTHNTHAFTHTLIPPPSLPFQPQALSDGGINIPGCCPEGATYFSPPCPEPCNAAAADAAYAVAYVSGVHVYVCMCVHSNMSVASVCRHSKSHSCDRNPNQAAARQPPRTRSYVTGELLCVCQSQETPTLLSVCTNLKRHQPAICVYQSQETPTRYAINHQSCCAHTH